MSRPKSPPPPKGEAQAWDRRREARKKTDAPAEPRPLDPPPPTPATPAGGGHYASDGSGDESEPGRKD